VIEYVYNQDERIVKWAEALLGNGHRMRDDAKAIAMEVDGELRGAVLFDTFGVNDCLVTVVSNGKRRWLTKAFIVRAMAFPFIQCNFTRITCLVARKNTLSRHFIRRFGGWKLEGIMRRAGPGGDDLLLYGMLREECLWLPLPEPPLAV
jgi:hypothetical protein